MKKGINEEGKGSKEKEDKKELLELRNKEELISNRDC